MRWTGIIVGLFLIFHLADLTWGPANPHFVRGDAYDNLFASFDRVPVAIIYIVANIALGVPHLPRRVEHVPEPRAQQPTLQHLAPVLRRSRFAVVVTVGNVSMPLLIATGVVTK